MRDSAELSTATATWHAFMQGGLRLLRHRKYLLLHFSELATEAAQPIQVLYLYFRSKDDFLDAWIDEIESAIPWPAAELSRMMEHARPTILLRFWDFYQQFGMILRALDEAAAASPHFAKRRATLCTRGIGAIASMLLRTQARGERISCHAGLLANSAARLIWHCADQWLTQSERLHAHGIDEAAAQAHMLLLVDRLLGPAAADDTAKAEFSALDRAPDHFFHDFAGAAKNPRHPGVTP
jgi:AcrR family transcriptional regulator